MELNPPGHPEALEATSLDESAGRTCEPIPAAGPKLKLIPTAGLGPPTRVCQLEAPLAPSRNLCDVIWAPRRSDPLQGVKMIAVP